jgi:hypothetical protein
MSGDASCPAANYIAVVFCLFDFFAKPGRTQNL